MNGVVKMNCPPAPYSGSLGILPGMIYPHLDEYTRCWQLYHFDEGFPDIAVKYMRPIVRNSPYELTVEEQESILKAVRTFSLILLDYYSRAMEETLLGSFCAGSNYGFPYNGVLTNPPIPEKPELEQEASE